MKKVFLILVVLSLFAVQSSFAALAQSGTGSITCGTSGSMPLDIQLSPNVFGAYSGLERVASSGTFDFFIIATYHTAGNRIFATAQSLTKIYKAETDSATDLVGRYSEVPTDVTGAESDAVWASYDGWSAL